MSHKVVWTIPGKVVVAVIIVIIAAFLSFAGLKATSIIVKAVRIGRLAKPNTGKISQTIQGNDYESLKAALDKEIGLSQEHLNNAKDLERKYPEDSRPKNNRKAWEQHFALSEGQFFSVLKEIFQPDNETTIEKSTVVELRAEYRRRTEIIDKRLGILSDLSEKYPKYDTHELVSALKTVRQHFRDAHYPCPQHQSFCSNCISQRQPCQACDGKGKWSGWVLTYKCKLCGGTGSVYAPGRTYCHQCHGRWDKGINCKICDEGLIPCPSHDESKTTCPNCGTVDGDLSGQSLEP